MGVRIEDYAIIGDGETAALVSSAGSIDWLCWPRFDSRACFAALLGSAEHGCWRIAPAGRIEDPSRLPGRIRLILETTFETAGGTANVVDFMPPRGSHSDVVRIVQGLSGSVAFRSDLLVRFDYGSIIPWMSQIRGAGSELHAVAGPDKLTLRTPIELRTVEGHSLGEFSVSAGEEVPFVLTYSRSHLPVPRAITPAVALARHAEILGPVVRPVRLRRTLARRRAALAHRLSSRSSIIRPAASSPRLRPHCPSRSADHATGTIGFAGCAMRPSRCLP